MNNYNMFIAILKNTKTFRILFFSLLLSIPSYHLKKKKRDREGRYPFQEGFPKYNSEGIPPFPF